MALETVEEDHSKELAVSSSTAMARHEIEGSIVLAKRFPRNQDQAFAMVMKSCQRFSFASMTTYSYPRGGQQITGASVHLAREAARCWGNLRTGCDIVHDDEETRTIRGWAWDIESNVREAQDASFKKLIYRKPKRGEPGGWIVPDERDLRELTNRQGAICVRNCILHLLPPDLIEDALGTAKGTIKNDKPTDPDEARKKIIMGFQGIGVSVDDLETKLGHPLRQVTPEEIKSLREIWASIREGNSVWAEHIEDTKPEESEQTPEVTMTDLTGRGKRGGKKGKSKPEDPVVEPDQKAQTNPDMIWTDAEIAVLNECEIATAPCEDIPRVKAIDAVYKKRNDDGEISDRLYSKLLVVTGRKRQEITAKTG
jgi:hypothetical protein